MAAPRTMKPAIALSEAEERDAYPHPGHRISEVEALYSQKPLPEVPQTPKARRRKVPAQVLYFPYPQVASVPIRTSSSQHPWAAAAAGSDISTSYPWAAAGTTTASRAQKRANRDSSFYRGGLGSQSSEIVNSRLGFQLDLSDTDPTEPRDRSSVSSAAGYYMDDASASEADTDDLDDRQGAYDTQEGPVPVEIADGGFPSYDVLLAPKYKDVVAPTPLSMPPRHGKSQSTSTASLSNPSNGSPTLGHEAYFGLGGGRPAVRKPSLRGRFTDKYTADKYHKIAWQISQSKMPPEPATAPPSPPASPGRGGKKTKVAGRFRTTAFTRLRGNARPKDIPKTTATTPPPELPPLPPPSSPFAPDVDSLRPVSPTAVLEDKTLRKQSTASFDEDALRRHCAPRLSAVGVVPVAAPPPRTTYSPFPPQRTMRPSGIPPNYPWPPVPVANQSSVFDCDDSDPEEDLARRDAPRGWFRRSGENGGRSSSEMPPSAHRRQEDKTRLPSTSSASSAGAGVKGRLANAARGLAGQLPADRRRDDLRKSIRVLHSSEESKEAKTPAEGEAKPTNKPKKPKGGISYLDGIGVLL